MKYSNSWHLLTNEEVLKELRTDMYKGLPTPEAKRRKRKYGTNSVWHVKRGSAGEVVLSTLFDLATLLLVVSALCAALFDKNGEAGALAVILVLTGLFRALTYLRAKRIFEDMAAEKIPVSSVIRDGRILLVPATEIVPGDIVFLEMGDTVPCDGRVVSGEDAVVSERGITENRTPVHKFNTVIKSESQSGEIPCEFRSNILFAGSTVLSGSVRMVAVACGPGTLIMMQKGGVEIAPPDKIPLVQKLAKKSKVFSLLTLAAAMVLTWLSVFIGGDFKFAEVFLCSMAMAVAAMSDFMTAIGTVIIAITLRDAADGKTDGVFDNRILSRPADEGDRLTVEGEKASSSRIIVRSPNLLESIAKPDVLVLCGTQYLKSGRSELYSYRVRGVYCPNYKLEKHEGGRIAPLAELLLLASAATAETGRGMLAAGIGRGSGESGALVKRATLAYEHKTGGKIGNPLPVFDHCGAGERRSVPADCSVTAVGQKKYFVLCGAPGEILNLCTEMETVRGRLPISFETRKEIVTECAELEFSGAKVIAVAKKRTESSAIDPMALHGDMTFVGFFALTQEPESETNSSLRANIEFIKKSGILPVLFSENPEGDLYYCHRFGLFNKRTRIVSAAELTGFDFDKLDENGMIVSFADLGGVFLTNAYEASMKALSCDGRFTLAAVGMDVWDAGALGSAQIGAAVSRSEYRSVPEPISKKAAMVIYPEKGRAEMGFGGFSGLVRAIKYARRAIENIDAASIYLTASQGARLFLLLAAVLTGIPMVNSVFILIWGLLFDFATALVMAFENNGRNDGYIRPKLVRSPDGYDEDEKNELMSRKMSLSSLAVGVIWGLVLVSVIPLFRLLAPLLGVAYTTEAGVALLSASVILSGTVLALEIMKRGSIFVGQHPNVAQLCYLFAALLMTLLFALTNFGSSLVGGEPCTDGAVLLLFPMLVTLIGAEIAKARAKHKREHPAENKTKPKREKAKKAPAAEKPKAEEKHEAADTASPLKPKKEKKKKPPKPKKPSKTAKSKKKKYHYFEEEDDEDEAPAEETEATPKVTAFIEEN